MYQVEDKLSVIKPVTHLIELRKVEDQLGYLIISKIVDCGRPVCSNCPNQNEAHGYRLVGDDKFIDESARWWCGIQLDKDLKPKGSLTKPKQFKLPHHV